MPGPPFYNEHGIPSSRWLALDADGAVGMFECGEAGAVPLPWPLGTLPGDFYVDRFLLDALRAADVIASGRALPRWRGRIGLRVIATLNRHAATATYRGGLRASTFEAALAPDRVYSVAESPLRTIASLRALDSALVETRARDVCVAGAMDEDALATWIDGLGDTGIYRWKSLDPSAVGLYSRIDAPARPIALGELPERAQRDLDLVRFSVSFADAEVLQLADHFVRSDLVMRGASDTLRAVRTAGGPRTP